MQTPENQVLPWHEPELRHALEHRSRVPHAILLHGREGIGKLRFARALAQSLLCESPRDELACGICSACGWFGSGNHPDFRLVEPAALTEADDEGEGAAKSSARILIEQIRDLTDFINVSSHRGGAKVALIHPAEALNVNAANALLKNLEEPPPGTHFVLVAHRVQFLLPTIRSRCRHLAPGVPAPEMAAKWLREQGVRDPELALAHTGGAPLLAHSLDGHDYWQRREVLLEQIAVRRFDPLAAADQLYDQPLREILASLQKWTFDLVLHKCLGRVRYNPDRSQALATLAAHADALKVLRFHRELLKLQRVIDHPLNPRLLLEQLLLDYAAAVGAAGHAA